MLGFKVVNKLEKVLFDLRPMYKVWDGRDQSMSNMGTNFPHLGYPLGVEVENSQLIEWIGALS